MTTDYIRSLGMRAGLWIEPEIVGKDCTEMLSYYDDECFIRRNGQKSLRDGTIFFGLPQCKGRQIYVRNYSSNGGGLRCGLYKNGLKRGCRHRYERNVG